MNLTFQIWFSTNVWNILVFALKVCQEHTHTWEWPSSCWDDHSPNFQDPQEEGWGKMPLNLSLPDFQNRWGNQWHDSSHSLSTSHATELVTNFSLFIFQHDSSFPFSGIKWDAMSSSMGLNSPSNTHVLCNLGQFTFNSFSSQLIIMSVPWPYCENYT